MCLDADLDAAGWVTVLRTARRDIDLVGLRSIFYRSPTNFEFPDSLSNAELRHVRMEAKLAFSGCLSGLPDMLWANHPARQADMTKPAQLAAARALGLRVPRSKITNSPDAVRKFAADVAGPIVVKPLGFGSIVDQHGRAALYTHVLSDADLADLRGVETTAHLFQAYIAAKAYELRLSCVGSGAAARLLPVAIHASSPRATTDFRADYPSLSYRIAEVPAEVQAGVRGFMTRFGIELGHFDFCVDTDGQHWFLECNGSGGQYQFAEQATGLPITEAIAELLAKGAL